MRHDNLCQNKLHCFVDNSAISHGGGGGILAYESVLSFLWTFSNITQHRNIDNGFLMGNSVVGWVCVVFGKSKDEPNTKR